MIREIVATKKQHTTQVKFESVLFDIVTDARNSGNFYGKDKEYINSIDSAEIGAFSYALYEINEALITGASVFIVDHSQPSSIDYSIGYYSIYYVKNNKLKKLILNNLNPLFKGCVHKKFGICFRIKFVNGEKQYDSCDILQYLFKLAGACSWTVK